jgi:ABC-type transport system involved in cytochrome c biogenesis ATPase subunit
VPYDIRAAAAAMLGLDLEAPHCRMRPDLSELAAGVMRAIEDDACAGRAGVTLVRGPSGAGKTTLLRNVAAMARERGWRVLNPMALTLDPRRCAIDHVARAMLAHRAVADGDANARVEACLRALARVGLAEASAIARPLGALSTGQQQRLRLAVALARVSRGPRSVQGSNRARRTLLVLDEFAAALDGPAAASLAHVVRREATRSAHVLLATHRHEAAAVLAAARHVELELTHAGRVLDSASEKVHNVASDAACAHAAGAIAIEPGDREDYLALAPLHYRAGEPATMVRVLAARAACERGPVGVLVASMPVLNGPWRREVWPGVFERGTARERAIALNDARTGVRCISRVIVDPRFRSLGVATMLVRAYLREPMTPRTEALAVMGRASSFFERAGMTPHAMTPANRHVRLMRALALAHVTACDLATPGRTLRRVMRTRRAHEIERALRSWAGASRATARLRDASLVDVLRAAARSAMSRPLVFTHG